MNNKIEIKVLRTFGWLLCILTLCLSLNFVFQNNSNQSARNLATQVGQRGQALQDQSMPMSQKNLESLQDLQQFVD